MGLCPTPLAYFQKSRHTLPPKKDRLFKSNGLFILIQLLTADFITAFIMVMVMMIL
jgi:hypothetical protein